MVDYEKLSYDDFVGDIGVSDNEADFFCGVEIAVDGFITKQRELKKEVENELRKHTELKEKMRGYMVRYMSETGAIQLKGMDFGSVNFQKEKVEIKTVSKREIQVGRSYQSLDDMTKDELVKMLESKGVRTRVIANKEEVVKKASIRVIR